MPYSKPLELAALMLEDKLEAAARSLVLSGRNFGSLENRRFIVHKLTVSNERN